jgi:hypothetical protein
VFVTSVLATLNGLVAALSLTTPVPATPTTLCTLQDSRITEASGIAVGPGVLWTHDDSGDTARFFALDRHCRTRATYDVGNETATDWEDVARGAGALWFGDIGDNSSRRSSVEVVKVPEPRVTPGDHQVRATVLRFRYADGPHDAEALLVHPRTGQLFVVTKSYGGWAGVYAAPLHPATSATNVLTRVAAFHLSPTGTPGGPAGPLGQVAVTSGDINASATRVVVRTYTDAYEWRIPDGDVAEAFGTAPGRTALPADRQGEGIAYDTDGLSWVTSSEGAQAPVRRITR